MSLKDHLKQLGFVEDDAPKAASVPAPTPMPTPTTPVQTPGYTGGFSTPANLFAGTSVPSIAIPDQNLVAALTQAVEQSTKEAYAQFKVILDTLQGMPDVQRYAMALKLVEASHHATVTDVLDSLDDRLALLEKQKQDFTAAYQNEVGQQVTAPANDVAQIEAAIAAKKQEIADLEQKRVTLVQQTTKAQNELDAQNATFNASATVVQTALSSEKQRIAAYIPQQATK